jgi:phage terminase large subunit GpA-like protein
LTCCATALRVGRPRQRPPALGTTHLERLHEDDAVRAGDLTQLHRGPGFFFHRHHPRSTTWPHSGGGTLRLDATIVDSGDGAWTAKVYDYCRARFARRVLAAKGVAGVRPPLTRSSAKGVPLFLIGVDGLKAQILQRLARGNTLRFSGRLEPDYWQQVTAERRVLRYVRGAPVRRFERIPGRRAEALDCLVYALAARHVVTADLERREAELATQAAPAARPRVVRSAWIEGR